MADPSRETFECIYCGGTFRVDAMSPAHVMMKGIGGRITSRWSVCTDCNHETQPAEDYLISAFRPFAARLGSYKGDGDPVPPDRVRVPGHGEVEVWQGVVKTRRSDTTPVIENGTKRVTFHGAERERVVKQFVDMMYRDGHTPADLRSTRGSFEFGDPRTDPVPQAGDIKIELSGILPSQALVKMALELIAYHDASLARRPELRAVREFVLNGQPSACHPVLEIEAPTRGPLSHDEPIFANTIEVWTAADNGDVHLIGRVTLYGFFTFSFTLSPQWRGPGFATRYYVDPTDPAFRPAPQFELIEPAALPDLWPRTTSSSPAAADAFRAAVEQALDSFVTSRQGPPPEPIVIDIDELRARE